VSDIDSDTAMRLAALAHVRNLSEIRDQLTARDLTPGFQFEGVRIPLINPQRGIFKPTQMRYLLSIKTVFPRPGGRVWYDDQRDVHRQIFAGVDTIEYAFMGRNPNAADNRWLREAFENRVPIIYFLGIAPGRYQAFLPVFITSWDAASLKVDIAFGLPESQAMAPPQNEIERRYALRVVKQRLHQASFREAEWRAVTHTVRAVSAQRRLTVRARRSTTDRFVRLAFDQGALYAPGHGLRFFQADADQVVRLSALEGRDLRRCRYSRFVLNDQLNPHLHIDSRRPN
jgi:hypothetical protein